MDKRVAQYLRLESLFFQTTVRRRLRSPASSLFLRLRISAPEKNDNNNNNRMWLTRERRRRTAKSPPYDFDKLCWDPKSKSVFLFLVLFLVIMNVISPSNACEHNHSLCLIFEYFHRIHFHSRIKRDSCNLAGIWLVEDDDDDDDDVRAVGVSATPVAKELYSRSTSNHFQL